MCRKIHFLYFLQDYCHYVNQIDVFKRPRVRYHQRHKVLFNCFEALLILRFPPMIVLGAHGANFVGGYLWNNSNIMNDMICCQLLRCCCFVLHCIHKRSGLVLGFTCLSYLSRFRTPFEFLHHYALLFYLSNSKDFLVFDEVYHHLYSLHMIRLGQLQWWLLLQYMDLLMLILQSLQRNKLQQRKLQQVML